MPVFSVSERLVFTKHTTCCRVEGKLKVPGKDSSYSRLGLLTMITRKTTRRGSSNLHIVYIILVIWKTSFISSFSSHPVFNQKKSITSKPYITSLHALNLNKESTADDVLQELKNKEMLAPHAKGKGGTAIITGGNSGIGAETVKTLIDAGMDVFLLTNEMESGEKLKNDISLSRNKNNITLKYLDLSDLNCVAQVANEIKESLSSTKTIHVIVNNAGIGGLKEPTMSPQNIEKTFAVNHVGHFMLTRLLLPHMDPNGGRVVSVSSSAHLSVSDDELDWGKIKNYDFFNPYAQSKLCNVLFAKELGDRLEEEIAIMKNDNNSDIQIASVSLHPGIIDTGIWRELPGFFSTIFKFFSVDKTVEQGAATTIFCALADIACIQNGGYYDDCQLVVDNVKASSGKKANRESKELREDLWQVTEDLIASCGFKLPSKLMTMTTSTSSSPLS